MKDSRSLKCLNIATYSDLLSSIFNDISFFIVDKAKMEKQPNDNLFMAWKGMMDIFEPSTPFTKLVLKKEFQNTKVSSIEIDLDV